MENDFNMNLKLMIFIVISYLIGCFCAAYYYGIIFKNTDIREHGSGNLGAMNSGRVLGKGSFVVVLLIDFFKGMIVVLLGRAFSFNNADILIFMFAVVIGHIFPIQLKFKGGKGIATFMGALTAYNYLFTLIVVIIFIPIYIISRKFTISGLIAILFLPFIIFISNYHTNGSEALRILPFVFIIILKHKQNILSR